MTLAVISKAIESRRKEFVESAVESSRKNMELIYSQLERHGWDLNAYAPRPALGNYFEYKKNLKFHRYVCSLVSFPASGTFGQPIIVSRNDKAVSSLLAVVERSANATFDKYAYKLAFKVGECEKAEIDCMPLWNGSILTVEKSDGTSQRWKTKTIINTSVLGNQFFQFPTRLCK